MYKRQAQYVAAEVDMPEEAEEEVVEGEATPAEEAPKAACCLLYTSDAADERSSVDLGGRRIIKKKNDN